MVYADADELAELRVEVQRLRRRLDGLRVQRDARIREIQVLEEALSSSRAGPAGTAPARRSRPPRTRTRLRATGIDVLARRAPAVLRVLVVAKGRARRGGLLLR